MYGFTATSHQEILPGRWKVPPVPQHALPHQQPSVAPAYVPTGHKICPGALPKQLEALQNQY